MEIEVPTRQSYVASLVAPSERSFASSDQCRTQGLLSNRLGYRPGLLMLIVAFSAPLCVGRGAKITYDLLLYRSFRGLKPPEENPRSISQQIVAPPGRQSATAKINSLTFFANHFQVRNADIADFSRFLFPVLLSFALLSFG